MKKYENDNITVRVCGYPRCCLKPVGKTVWVCTRTRTGTGFTGMGPGWTSPTCAIPVCHPRYGYSTHGYFIFQNPYLYSPCIQEPGTCYPWVFRHNQVQSGTVRHSQAYSSYGKLLVHRMIYYIIYQIYATTYCSTYALDVMPTLYGIYVL